jgi:hypothetical protein
MNFALNTQIDLITTAALPFKGNASIYNSLLKEIDVNVEIPPAAGKGQIMDLVGKIFSQPQYETIKNEISKIILNVDSSKGTTILKLIKLFTLFRPENESLITPLYTKLSHDLEMAPPGYLESLLAQVSGLQEPIKVAESKINPTKFLESIQGMISKKGGIKNKKTKKNKAGRKNKKTNKNKGRKSRRRGIRK